MKNYPLRLTILYFFTATLWIFFSDKAVELLFPPSLHNTVQSIKGFTFVILSAIGLFFFARHYYHLIQKNEIEYRKLFKDNPHPMWVYDSETFSFLLVNNAAIIKYGYSQEEFLNLKITDIRPETEQSVLADFIRRSDSRVYLDSGIWQHRTKEGKLFFVRVSSHATTFEGRKARVVLAFDMDEQQKAQQQLQLSESKLKGLIDNSDDLIWMIDKEGAVVTANEAFRNKFRQLLEMELSQKLDLRQLPDNGFTRNWDMYFRQAFQGKHLRIEEEVKDGKTEYYEIIVNPIYNERGEIFGVGCFARDISQRKEKENQIKQQVEALKEVAWVQSHEVRKPLANILGLIGLIRAKQNDEQQLQQLITHMEESGKELDAIIKKVVDKSATLNNDPST
jgi:PAS domain S-box-containing protein